ncbi:GNAT family N-acetyltransferase [Mycobacterium haemophilum]
MTTTIESRKISSETLQLEVRLARHHDWPVFAERQARTFGAPMSAEETEGWRRQIDFEEDCVVVEDVTDPDCPYFIGATAWKPMSLTVPGKRQMAVAGSGMTLIAPEYRRRGILRKMLEMELDRIAQQGYTAVIGTVSQGGVYDRFGYGPTSYRQETTVRIDTAAMRDAMPARPLIRQIGAADAVECIPGKFASWQACTTGAISRGPEWWKAHFNSRFQTDRANRLHYLTHPDGYLSYYIYNQLGRHGEIIIEDFCPLTNAAHTELLDAVFGMELFASASLSIPTDDPLRLKLNNPHAMKVQNITDMIWMRIIDVPAALRARAYDVDDVETVLKITDPIDKSTRLYNFRIRGGEGECRLVDGTMEASVSLGLPELAMIYLGAHRPSDLAQVGRISATDPKALKDLDQAFATSNAPFCNTSF